MMEVRIDDLSDDLCSIDSKRVNHRNDDLQPTSKTCLVERVCASQGEKHQKKGK